MPRFLVDASCMVATLCSWREHHKRSEREIERRLDVGDVMVMEGPALAEAYVVLTRLPSPYRLSAADAVELLEANFLRDDTHATALDSGGYREVIRRAGARGTASGHVYDTVIIAFARAAEVKTILTFDERHFRHLAAEGVEIAVPA